MVYSTCLINWSIPAKVNCLVHQEFILLVICFPLLAYNPIQTIYLKPKELQIFIGGLYSLNLNISIICCLNLYNHTPPQRIKSSLLLSFAARPDKILNSSRTSSNRSCMPYACQKRSKIFCKTLTRMLELSAHLGYNSQWVFASIIEKRFITITKRQGEVESHCLNPFLLSK